MGMAINKQAKVHNPALIARSNDGLGGWRQKASPSFPPMLIAEP